MKRRSRDSSSNLAAAAAMTTTTTIPSPEAPPAKRARRRSSLNGGEEYLSADKNSDDVIAPPPIPAPTSIKKQKDKKTSASVTSSTVGSVNASPRSTTSNNMPQEALPIIDKCDAQPFAIGHCLVVKYRDNSHRLAKIIENMKKDDGGYNYYVHYFDFNRRMDEWIEDSRIISFPSVANPMEAQYAHHHHHHATQSSETTTTNSQHVAEDEQQKSGHDGQILTTIAELEHDEHEGLDEAQLKEHELITKVKNIQRVQLGKYSMECWYFSPFPKEFFSKGFAECLYFCEYSLRFFSTKEELIHFQKNGFAAQTLPLHPPGHEIYRDEHLSMFELDGSMERIYCQNLCYFAKLFLDHKTLFWDVDAFLFYVLCTRDARGFHPVGYFSKEKYSDLGYNLACILTFPCVQRRGYGRFLIEFSYELSKKEDKFGSPEKPLSDLGALGYKSYWAATLVRLLRDKIANTGGIDHITIADLACLTSIQPDDIIATLQYLGLLLTYKEYAQKYLLLPAPVEDGGNAEEEPLAVAVEAAEDECDGPESATTTATASDNHDRHDQSNHSGSDDDAQGLDIDQDQDQGDATSPTASVSAKSSQLLAPDQTISNSYDDGTGSSSSGGAVANTVDLTGDQADSTATTATTATATATGTANQKSKQPPQLRRHHMQKSAQKLAQKTKQQSSAATAATSAAAVDSAAPATSTATAVSLSSSAAAVAVTNTASIAVVTDTAAAAAAAGAVSSSAASSSSTAAAAADESYILLCDSALLEELARMYPEGSCRVQPHRLHWTPFYFMDPRKDKWALFQLRNSTQANPLTCHVLPYLQREQQQEQQQQQQLQQQQQQLQQSSQLAADKPLTSFARSLSLSLFGSVAAQAHNTAGSPSFALVAGAATLGSTAAAAAAGAVATTMPVLSRQTTLLLGGR